MHRAFLGRRSDKLQCCFTAVSNGVDGKCVLNLEKHKQYSYKTSVRWRLYQSSQPWFHLCGVITAELQNSFHNDTQFGCSVLHAGSYTYVGMYITLHPPVKAGCYYVIKRVIMMFLSHMVLKS